MKLAVIILLCLFVLIVGFLVVSTLKTLKTEFGYFKKKQTSKLIKIPLVSNGKETGTYVECIEGDYYYNQLIKLYGNPLPKTIETIPLVEKK